MAEPSWEQATPADLRKLVGELDEAASDQVLGWLGRDRGFALNVWELDRDPAAPGHVVVSQDLVAHEPLRCRVEELVAVLPPLVGSARPDWAPDPRALLDEVEPSVVVEHGTRRRRRLAMPRRRAPVEPARRSMVSHFSGCHRRRQVRQLLRWAVAEGDAPPDGSLRVLDPGFATGTLRSGRVTHELTVHTVEQADRVEVLVGYPSARGAGHPLQALSASPPDRLRAVVDGLDVGDADHLAGWLAGGEGMGVGHWLLAQRPGGDVVVLVDGRDPGRRLVVTDEHLAWRIFVGCFGRSVRARGEDPVCPGLVPSGITAADLAEHGMRINDVRCG